MNLLLLSILLKSNEIPPLTQSTPLGRTSPNIRGDTLFFLVGEDHVAALPKWNEFEELDQLVQFVILSRSDLPLNVKYPVVRRRFDLSSTEIRNRVANYLPISYLVPENVLRYIQVRKLYRGEVYRS